MREIDPFSYYLDQASAIPGLGGNHPSADPRYCFHTSYMNVHPGPACYRLDLRGVCATHGRLSLRIHALRPGSMESASFVGGARIEIAVHDRRDLSIGVPFVAQRQTQYAFYGQFINDTDVQADAVIVVLEEEGAQEGDYVAPPRSVLAPERNDESLRSDIALLHVLGHHLFTPVSQDCTRAQMAELENGYQSIDDWAEAVCLNALRTNDVTRPGLEGLLIGHSSNNFSDALTHAGFSLRQLGANPPPEQRSDIFADFLVWPEGLWADEDAGRRWNSVKAWFARLKIGGVGIVTCRFRPENGQHKRSPAPDGPQITQSEIERWALRLIALGYTVAPLAFSPPEVQQTDENGLVRFALVARRI